MSLNTSGSATSTTLPPHLQSNREIHVIISILSGSHTAQSHYDDTLKPYLDTYQVRYTTHVTQSTQTIIELTQDEILPKALRGVQQTLLLLSGDGGLIDIVDTMASQLHVTSSTTENVRASSQSGSSTNLHVVPTKIAFVKPVICLIPQGTANALAWSSKIAHDPLGTLMTGRAKTLPIFEVTFSPGSRLVTNEGSDREKITSPSHSHSFPAPVQGETNHPKMYGAVVFSWGIHASLVARSDTAAYRKHGIDRFKMAAYELLEENHAYSGNVSVRTIKSDEWQPLVIPEADISVSSSSANSNADDHTDDQSDAASTSPDITTDDDDVTATANTSAASAGQSEDTKGASHNTTTAKSKGKLSYLAATLVSNLEEKYLISPHTKPISGAMFLISMPHVPAAAVASLTHLPYEHGQHIHDSRVGYQEIGGMRIDFSEDVAQWRQVCIDGKIVEVEKGGWVVLRNLSGEKSLRIDGGVTGEIVDVVVPDLT